MNCPRCESPHGVLYRTFGDNPVVTLTCDECGEITRIDVVLCPICSCLMYPCNVWGSKDYVSEAGYACPNCRATVTKAGYGTYRYLNSFDPSESEIEIKRIRLEHMYRG